MNSKYSKKMSSFMNSEKRRPLLNTRVILSLKLLAILLIILTISADLI